MDVSTQKPGPGHDEEVDARNVFGTTKQVEGARTSLTSDATLGSAVGSHLSAAGAEELQEMLQRRTDQAKSARGSAGVFVREQDYQAILRNVGHKEADKGRLQKLVMLLLLLIVILAAVAFATSLAASELAKESHITDGRLSDLNGNTVATKNSDFDVCVDGSLAQAGQCQEPGAPVAGRRLEDQPGSALKTVPTKQRQVLSSSLSDTFLMALDEVVVFSDKGHTLRLQIHGFARVPVLNSRCGNIVHLYTAWNGRLTLDSTDLSFDPQTEAAFANAGFSLITGGVSGRRLLEDHSVEGFFTAVQGVAAAGWKCQDVPLPTLPQTYSQRITVHRPCAVEGVTGSTLDMCDSKFGGVVPGTQKLSRAHQLATMTKTQRIRAQMSVDVPIEHTLFSTVEIETLKSTSYELQVTKLPNHPGQTKVHLFDRRSAADVHFQLITGKVSEGRFYCNSSAAGEVTTQKKELQGEKSGVERKMHFESMDMVEEGGRLLRHFRMMPSEAFLDWMGAKPASARPKDAYYEYWDVAEDLRPFRLLNADGSLVVFERSSGGTSDADVEARFSDLGAGRWASRTECTAEEKQTSDVTAPSLGMRVPKMLSPMMDLEKEDLAFYARLNLDEQAEDASGNGWESMVKRSSGTGPLAAFAGYALRSKVPVAVADVCRALCKVYFDALEAQLQADAALEFCEAPGLSAALTCMIDVAAARTQVCMKNNFMSTVSNECMAQASSRRLSDDEEDAELEYLTEQDNTQVQGSEAYLRRMGRLQQQSSEALKQSGYYQKAGETKQGHLRTLGDGTTAIDLDALDADQRSQLAAALGLKELTGGRVLFNATDDLPKQKVQALLEVDEVPGSVTDRRLMLDMNCISPGVGPGCIFKIGYPWHCDPTDGNPPCWFGIAVKMQIGGPAHGALTVSGAGCVDAWAFSVPPPFKGTVCIDGGISVSWSGACGLPFSLSGWVAITAQVGLDLVIFSFSFASIRLEAGAAVVNYAYNCDDRRRRRRGWGGRRRGADQSCQYRCDIKVYAQVTFQVLIGRVWGLMQYYVSSKDFDLIVGADIYIWLIFTSWWENVARVQLI